MQIRSALRQLVRGRRPITLFQADSFGSPRRRAQLEERAIAWLASGWSAYREICLPAGSGVAFRPGGS